MADKKITELPYIDTLSGSLVGTNTPLQNTVIPLVLRGNTNQINIENFSKFVTAYSAHTGSAGNTFTGPQTINNNVTITGNTSIGGTLVVAGKITAQEFFTEITSASIIFESGSTVFGNSGDDTHTFTGSMLTTGSIILNGSAIGTGQLNVQTASQDLVNRGISSVTGSINTTTSSFDSVFLGISSVTGSFRAEIGGIEEYTASLKGQAIVSSSTQITNYHKFAETASANTFYGNQSITGSLSVSAGEFNVTTGSLALTSSLRFDHTQNDGATLQLSHDNNTALADHAFNVTVKSAGVYTSFVQNGTPYSILNVEAFDNNKIYLYRDTRLYNKSLFIDNNLTVQKDVVIGTGSLDINNGEFSITSGSGELTSSLSFRHTTIDPITGNATLELRYRNNDVGPENNAWKFMASDSGVALVFEQEGVDRTLLTSNNAGDALIFRDTRLFGKGLTVDNELLVKQNTQITGSLIVLSGITGSLRATNGVVSSSNQLFELNQQTGSQSNLNAQIGIATASLNFTTGALNLFTGSVIGQTNTISTFTSSVNFTTQSLNTQTGSQDLVNRGVSSVTGSINTTTSSFDSVFLRISSTTGSINTTTSSFDSVFLRISSTTGSINTTTSSFDSVFLGISSVTGAINTQSSSQDLVNRGISSVTGSINTTTSSFNSVFSQIGSTTSSLIGITNGLMAFTAALDSTYATDAQLYQLYQATSSIQFATASLNTQTGSQNSINFNISVVTSSIDAHILKQSTQTGSQDLVNLGISTYTGSQNLINSSVDSHILKQATQTGSQDLVNLGISTFTGSLRSEVNLIEAYTASLKSALTISGTDVTFAGKITAQEFTTVYTTSSILYQSGSTKFGNSSDDTHEFTGSVDVNGSITGSLLATNGIVSSSNQIPQLFPLMQATASINITSASLNTFTGSIRGEVSGIEAYTSSLKSAFSVSGTTTTHSGPINLSDNTIYSHFSQPANVSSGNTTVYTYSQLAGEFTVGFEYSIMSLYAPSGTNLFGVSHGFAYFMADGSTNANYISQLVNNGWTPSLSSTNAGVFTITFTAGGAATHTNINIRIRKINRTGAG